MNCAQLNGSTEASLKRKSPQRKSPRFAGRWEHQTSHHRRQGSTCFFKLSSPRGRILQSRWRRKIRRRLPYPPLFLLGRTKAKRQSSEYDTDKTFRTNFFPRLALNETSVPPCPARRRNASRTVCAVRGRLRFSRHPFFVAKGQNWDVMSRPRCHWSPSHQVA